MADRPDDFDDIGADIAAAIAEEKGRLEPVAPIAAEQHNKNVEELAGDLSAPEGETAEQKQARIDATGRAHDEKGRFAEKPQAKAASKPKKDPEPEAPKAAEPPAAAQAPEQKPEGEQPKPLQPPSHWSAQAKAEFMNAPRALQEQALKREQEISEKSKEWQGKAEDYNRLDKVLSPHRTRWAQRGMTPEVAVNALLSFEQQLSTDPVNGVASVLRAFARGNELGVIHEIARQNGLELVRATNQGDQPNNGQAPAQVDPTVRQLQEQVQNLTNHITQSRTASVEQQQKAFTDEVQAFAAKPENLYFGNVVGAMKVLIANGDANGDTRPVQERLKEAYDQACWANPEIRTLMLAEQAKKDQAEQARKAAAARHAAGSVTGSPGDGAPAPKPRSRNNSIEDDVREALLESRA